MGIFSIIKGGFKFWKELKTTVKEQEKQQEHYIAMSLEDLSALSQDELFDAVEARTEHKVDSFDEWEDGVNSLNANQKLFYSINWLEIEVNNGGLCQFFTNSSKMVAPYVSEYMKIIGADAHKKLYDDFVSKYNIDLTDLSFMDDCDDFEELEKKYPFNEYDDAFYDMEPLETYLKKYIKEHLADF